LRNAFTATVSSRANRVSSTRSSVALRLLGISEREVLFETRGFVRRGAASHLEEVGRSFVRGYNSALSADGSTLSATLNSHAAEFVGFAYEGAAMALTLLDRLVPGKRKRFAQFTTAAGRPHVYMVHVGAGWAWARLPWVRIRLDAAIRSLDPLLRWLAVDGYGFHQGFFAADKFVRRRQRPRFLQGYAARAFDQGLGRSLWFSCCADVEHITQAVWSFESERQSDLWSGVGLACAYAGGADTGAVRTLLGASGPSAASFAQGVAFAAKARERAGNPAAHTDAIARATCHQPAADLARITDLALERLPPDASVPSYEIWRQRIQAMLAPSCAASLA
jgi:hypothetical protein